MTQPPPPHSGTQHPVLSARGVKKAFGHVEALRGADLTVGAGEITALVGDNGAGKSTLVKVLSGVLTPDEGEITFDGRVVSHTSAIAARTLGIETVYQDLALADDLDPTANMFLGREVLREGWLGRVGFLDERAMRQRAHESFAKLGVDLPSSRQPVAALSGGQRQAVAVSRAATWASRVIFMDEPTAALGVVQTAKVLDLIRRLRAGGMSVVLISHNLAEVFEVADHIEVLRLGTRVASLRTADVETGDVVAAMTGAITNGLGA